LTEMLNPIGGTGTIIGFGQGKSITVTDPISKTSMSIPSLTGFINFLKRTTKANILSRPAITVIDNQDGEIEVGDQVPVSVTRVAATATTPEQTTANFQDATIKLKIKPFISPATNSIRMEIDQKIKQPTTVEGLPKELSDN